MLVMLQYAVVPSIPNLSEPVMSLDHLLLESLRYIVEGFKAGPPDWTNVPEKALFRFLSG